MMVVLAVMVVLMALAALRAAADGFLPTAVRERACQGREWRRAFPQASKSEIREFISVFTDAFGFGRREGLRFSPGDNILCIYRDLYSREWMPDSLELESFAAGVEARYRIAFREIWHKDLTLGELFVAARARSGQQSR